MAKNKIKTHVKVKLSGRAGKIAVIPIASSMLLEREDTVSGETEKVINRDGATHFIEEKPAVKTRYFAITLINNVYWDIEKEEYERLLPILT